MKRHVHFHEHDGSFHAHGHEHEPRIPEPPSARKDRWVGAYGALFVGRDSQGPDAHAHSARQEPARA